MEEVYEVYDFWVGFVEDRLQYDVEELFIVKGVYFLELEDDFDLFFKFESKYCWMLFNLRDELVQFWFGLVWLGFDQFIIFSVIWLWIFFVLFVVVVFIFNFNFVLCDICDESWKYLFEKLV